MEQHPIPQNVSSYQFKLVGDMTLKQFFQLAGGLLVALIFYSTPLIGIVKWPFIIVSSLLGVALAFLPLEERPLEKWIFAFFKAIYEPTEFFWAKTTAAPNFFQAEPAEAAIVASDQQGAALNEYLATSAPKTGPLANLEGAEQGFLKTLSGLFSGVVGTVTNLGTGMATTTVATPEMDSTISPQASSGPREIKVPQQIPIKITPTNMPRMVVEEKPQISNSPQITTSQVAPTMGNEFVSTKQAMFSVDAAPPNPPTYPNVVVGQVVDEQRKIVEGAIIEIRDSSGRPARALRSNKVGHFITVTPLENGTYNIAAEKDAFEFVPVSFTASGALIPPILVQGKRIAQTTTVPVASVNPTQQPVSPVLNPNFQ